MRTTPPSSNAAWTPATDEQLTWFQPGGRFPARPRPLDFTLEVEAFAFGFSRALESLYFPLYELRARLIDYNLFFGVAPSALAEQNLDAQFRRLRDSALRFTRNIRAAWDQTIRSEILEYRDRLLAFPPAGASDAEVAEGLRTIQRVRANQWFASTRAVFAPAALLQHGVGETSPEEAAAVVEEAVDYMDSGEVLVGAALARAVRRLPESCVYPEDVVWLKLAEVRHALVHGGDLRAVAVYRRAETQRHIGYGGLWPTFGAPLPADAPRMYLVREILALTTPLPPEEEEEEDEL